MRLFQMTSLVIGNPFPLKQNEGKSFIGSYVLGMGFVLTPEQAKELISKNPRNKDVLFPYLNGEDLNNDPEQKPSRWVINFFDWSEEKARTYPDCFEIVERLVKPERQRWKLDENGAEITGTFALRKPLPQKWWIYSEKRPALYGTISKLDQVMAINRYTKYVAIDFQPKDIVFSDSIVVFGLDSYKHFSILSSSIHEMWAWKNSSTMGSSTLRYSASNSFETFPFPSVIPENLIEVSRQLDGLRRTFMKQNQLGFTELYNLLNEKNAIDLDDSLLRIRQLHCQLDNLTLAAYGWTDVQLKHDFYEVEYLPENDRTRFTIHPVARKEILLRLLKLNHQFHSIEVEDSAKTKSSPKKKTKYASDIDSSTLFNQ